MPREPTFLLPRSNTPRGEPICVGKNARGKGASVNCSRAVGTVIVGSSLLARQYDDFATTMDNEKCRVLIQLYGAKDFLWNSKSPLYHNKSVREDAWKEISSVMNIPVFELKKKMTTLLASYRREKSRIAKSLITGSGKYHTVL